MPSTVFADCPKNKSAAVCGYTQKRNALAILNATEQAQKEADKYCEPTCEAKIVEQDTTTTFGQAEKPSKPPADPIDPNASGEVIGVTPGSSPAENYWCAIFKVSCSEKKKEDTLSYAADAEELEILKYLHAE